MVGIPLHHLTPLTFPEHPFPCFKGSCYFYFGGPFSLGNLRAVLSENCHQPRKPQVNSHSSGVQLSGEAKIPTVPVGICPSGKGLFCGRVSPPTFGRPLYTIRHFWYSTMIYPACFYFNLIIVHTQQRLYITQSTLGQKQKSSNQALITVPQNKSVVPFPGSSRL